MTARLSYFTSESVSEAHPDNVADVIADSIVDAYLSLDAMSRLACIALCKSDTVVVAGEITSSATVDREAVVRQAVREVGYTSPNAPFSADTLQVFLSVTRQAPEIAAAVDESGTVVIREPEPRGSCSGMRPIRRRN